MYEIWLTILLTTGTGFGHAKWNYSINMQSSPLSMHLSGRASYLQISLAENECNGPGIFYTDYCLNSFSD